MLNINLAKEDLLKEIAKLQMKKEHASNIGPDYYEPGNMEYLDQYLGVYDESANTIMLRTEAKGLRYEERTPRLDYLSVGDPLRLVREPGNPFNENNIAILSESGESLGNLSAELCNVIAPLADLGFAEMKNAHASYIERIKDRSRYAKQGVLFIEFQIVFHGV